MRRVFALPHIVFAVLYIPCMFVLVSLWRNLARDHAQSDADMQRFSIRDALCAVEADRETVENNVVSLLRLLKCVPSDCTRKDALDAFDLLVQRTMPRLIRSSTGRVWLRYEYVVATLLPDILALFDTTAAHVSLGDSAQQVMSSIIESEHKITIVLPTCLRFRCVHVQPFPEPGRHMEPRVRRFRQRRLLSRVCAPVCRTAICADPCHR